MRILLRNMKDSYRNLSIKNKIMVIYIPLIIIPIFLLGYISNSIFTKAIIEKTIKNALDESKLITIQINSLLKNIEGNANTIMIDMNNTIKINSMSSEKKENKQNSEISKFNDINQMKNQIQFVLNSSEDIDYAEFIDTASNTYTFSADTYKYTREDIDSKIIEMVSQTSGENIWLPIQYRKSSITNETNPVLTLGKRVLNIDSQETIGTLLLNIKEDSFSNIYKTIGAVERNGYSIIDENGIVISSTVKADIFKPLKDESIKEWILSNGLIAEVKKVEGKEMLITSVPFGKNGWRLINEIPIKNLTEDSRKYTAAILIIGFGCLFLALLGGGVLSRAIVSPLLRLTKSMNKIKEGNLEVSFKTNSSDEVGLISSTFNEMIERIKRLLENIKMEQKEKREYELALIQAQVKPHFLYNTLDTIFLLSKMNREKSAQEVTKALADFYRTSLSSGNEIISIAEEIKNVTAYLMIQKVRYSDVLDFKINVEEGIEDLSILKLTIQPLVENSIYHGLKTKGSLGMINIDVLREGDNVIIKVIDDGIGMEQEKLEELLRENQNFKHFGLKNVDRRIKLYFGESYGIKIKTEKGAGTEVIITQPAIVRGKDNGI